MLVIKEIKETKETNKNKQKNRAGLALPFFYNITRSGFISFLDQRTTKDSPLRGFADSNRF